MKRLLIKLGMLAVVLNAGIPITVLATPVKDEFRFEQVKNAEVVYIKKGSLIREDKSEEARAVGKAEEPSVAYILEDSLDEWIYVESGKARGFLKRDCLLGCNNIQEIHQRKDRNEWGEAAAFIMPDQNEAYDYKKVTVKKTVVKKKPAIAKRNLKIHESKDLQKSRVVGTMTEGAVSYILADEDCKIVFVESGDVRGFVRKADFITGREASTILDGFEEKQIILARELIEPQENRACYYTLTSTREARTEETVRTEMVNFALQYVGNPYVWGGTSLTNGADCSGFVQSIYSHFGYSLPRVTTDQVCCGRKVSIAEARPGDLIFYQHADGYVYHVSMYIGDGQVVHAANSESGIITGGIWNDAVCAVSIIE